jgi:hypothetical protein
MLARTRAFLKRLTGSSEERRAHPRHDVDVQTSCRSLADDSDMPARIRNVSRSGVGLIVSRAVTAGTMMRVQFPGPADGPHTTILACVTNVSKIGPEQWALGCVFSLELSDSEMRIMGGEKTPTGTLDQRAWLRYPAKGSITYRPLPGDEIAVRSAELVDLSPAGVGLIVDQNLEAGSAITLRLRRQDEKPDRSMLACVVYVADRPDGKWAVGCNFLHELSEKELNELVWRSGS